MSWMGMSIPTLPGTSRRPNSKHPGAENIELDKPSDAETTPAKPEKKPLVNPTPRPQTPKRPPGRPSRKGN